MTAEPAEPRADEHRDDASGAVRPRRTVAAMVAAAVGAGLLGVVVGAVGTTAHAQWVPWGLIIALVATVAGGVWMRTWHAGTSVVGYAVGWVLITQVLALQGPGGDVLITNGVVGWVWLGIGPIAALAAMLAPRRWFVLPD